MTNTSRINCSRNWTLQRCIISKFIFRVILTVVLYLLKVYWWSADEPSKLLLNALLPRIIENNVSPDCLTLMNKTNQNTLNRGLQFQNEVLWKNRAEVNVVEKVLFIVKVLSMFKGESCSKQNYRSETIKSCDFPRSLGNSNPNRKYTSVETEYAVFWLVDHRFSFFSTKIHEKLHKTNQS